MIAYLIGYAKRQEKDLFFRGIRSLIEDFLSQAENPISRLIPVSFTNLKEPGCPGSFRLAEREGFEPSIELPLYRISSAAH